MILLSRNDENVNGMTLCDSLKFTNSGVYKNYMTSARPLRCADVPLYSPFPDDQCDLLHGISELFPVLFDDFFQCIS